MSEQSLLSKEQFLSKLVVFVSGLVTLLVILTFNISPPAIETDFNFKILPKFHAILNLCVSVLLILSWYFIVNKKITAHKTCNILALVLSAIFLISYTIYHTFTESTKYGGEGVLKIIYYIILISHIILAAIILPIILFTFMRAFLGQNEKHRKIAKWTMPLWLYVSITGVLVYLMISPYY